MKKVMSVLKKTLVVLLVIATVVFGLIVFGVNAYKLNPIQREISSQTNQWNKLVPLEHKKLTNVKSDEAQNWLMSKGFNLSERTHQERIPNPEGEPDWERTYQDIEADAIFERDSGNIACNIRFVVVMNYKDGHVAQARGMMNETGCL